MENFSSVKLRLAVVFLLTLTVAAWARPHPGVEYVKMRAADVPVHLVSVDLTRSDLILRPVIAPTGHRQVFKSLVKQHRPVAAINGTFFDTRTGITVGNLVTEGRLLAEGMSGSNLVFRNDGSVELVSSARNLGRYQDWSDVEFAVGGGPTLLADGEYFMSPKSEGFKDPSLFQPRPRTALGVTESGQLRMVVVTQSVTLWQMAKVMHELGCVHAINLDGGSSTGLSVGQKVVVNPARSLTNLVGVFPSHQSPEMNRAVSVAQSRAYGHYQKGLQLIEHRKLKRARSQMRQAVAKEPSQAAYWEGAARTELLMRNRPRAILDLAQAAHLYLRKGDLVSVQQMADRILELDFNNTTGHLLVAQARIEQGLDQEAVPSLRFVLEKQPGHPQAAELLTGIKFRAHGFRKLDTDSAE